MDCFVVLRTHFMVLQTRFVVLRTRFIVFRTPVAVLLTLLLILRSPGKVFDASLAHHASQCAAKIISPLALQPMESSA
jgi:hypothetical protein